MNTPRLSPELERDMLSKKIDRDLTLSILERYNRGEFDHFKPVRVGKIPRIDGKDLVDLENTQGYQIPRKDAWKRLSSLLPEEEFRSLGTKTGDTLYFSRTDLERIGEALLPYTAYGMLNGGSATSYIDGKKNRDFSKELYQLISSQFQEAARLSAGQPKGVTPAFIHPDGTPGPSFLELKLRSLLLHIKNYRLRRGLSDEQLDRLAGPLGMLPFFQMTSEYTDGAVRSAFSELHHRPFLESLAEEPAHRHIFDLSLIHI